MEGRARLQRDGPIDDDGRAGAEAESARAQAEECALAGPRRGGDKRARLAGAAAPDALIA